MPENEEKEEHKKKELHKVRVFITDDTGTSLETYRVIVSPDTTVEQEIEWRLEWIRGFGTWGIESDILIKEI